MHELSPQVRYAAIDAHCLTQAFDVLTGVSAAPGDPILPVVGARKSSDRVSVQVLHHLFVLSVDEGLNLVNLQSQAVHFPVCIVMPTNRSRSFCMDQLVACAMKYY